jgi:HK97 family phage prohead protease
MKDKDYIENIDGAERRMLTTPIEFREEGDQKEFVGTGIIYNSIADLGFFTEEVMPGAADGVLTDDVRGLVNHDPNLLLGRTKSGTMTLEPTTSGLIYLIKYNPNDPDHVRSREKVLRGDISQSSFAFSVQDDEWVTRDGKDHRIVKKIKRLYDMSLVTYPAYPNTTVAARSMESVKKEIESRDQSIKKELAELEREMLRLEIPQ